MIVNCTCTSDSNGNTNGADFQDVRLGKGRRIGNPTKDTNVNRRIGRCTVCGQIRDIA